MKLAGVSGYVHTVEDSSCACMKIIPGSASVNSVNQSINQFMSIRGMGLPRSSEPEAHVCTYVHT